MTDRCCQWCGRPLLEGRRRDTQFCSGRCRMRAHRLRLKTGNQERILAEWAMTGKVMRHGDGTYSLATRSTS